MILNCPIHSGKFTNNIYKYFLNISGSFFLYLRNIVYDVLLLVVWVVGAPDPPGGALPGPPVVPRADQVHLVVLPRHIALMKILSKVFFRFNQFFSLYIIKKVDYTESTAFIVIKTSCCRTYEKHCSAYQ